MYKIVAGINIKVNEWAFLELCKKYSVKIETCFILFLCVENADRIKRVSAIHYQPKPVNYEANFLFLNTLLASYINKSIRVKKAYIVFRDYLPLKDKIIQSLQVNYKISSPQEIYSNYRVLDEEREMIEFILLQKFKEVKVVSCPFTAKTLASNQVNFRTSSENGAVKIDYEVLNNGDVIDRNILFPFEDTDNLNIFSQVLNILMLSYLFYFVFLHK